MKKIFVWLLKKYSRTEKQRLEIFSSLYESVSETYSEQTTFGNVYNANIEFIMASPLIKKLVKDSRRGSSYASTFELDMIKKGLGVSTEDAINQIKIKKEI